MELVKGIDNIEPHSFGELCSICGGTSGCTIQCTSRECSKRWHPLCGLEAGWHMRISVESDKELAFCRTTLCSQHSTPSSGVPVNESSTNEKQIQQSSDGKNRADDINGKVSDLCSCLVPWDGVEFMIQCDWCEIWYHGACVGIQETDISKMDTFVCSRCRPPVSAPAAETSSQKSNKLETNLEGNALGVQTASDILDPEKSQLISKDLQSSEESDRKECTASIAYSTKASSFDDKQPNENVLAADENCNGDSQSGSEPESNTAVQEQSEISVTSRPSTLAPEFALKPISTLAGDRFGVIQDDRPPQPRHVIPSQSREFASRLSSRFGVSIKSILDIWESRDADDSWGAYDSEADCDVITCLSKFLIDVLDELEKGKDFVSTQTLQNLLKIYMISKRQKIPVQLKNLSWFGRYMATFRGMHRTKSLKVSGFWIDPDEIRRSLSATKSQDRVVPDWSERDVLEKERAAAAEDEDDSARGVSDMKKLESGDKSDVEPSLAEESQPRSPAGNASSESSEKVTSNIKTVGMMPQSGLRVLYKWNEFEWYEGTIGKNKSKASYNKISNHIRYKPSDWWSVIWDDGEYI